MQEATSDRAGPCDFPSFEIHRCDGSLERGRDSGSVAESAHSETLGRASEMRVARGKQEPYDSRSALLELLRCGNSRAQCPCALAAEGDAG
jgi:hypothetical protein